MGFSHLYGAGTLSTSEPVQLDLGAIPPQDSIVCIAFECYFTGASGTVGLNFSDENGNVYTITPSSPAFIHTGDNYFLETDLAYLIAPANAGRIITATWTSLSVFGSANLYGDVFSGAPKKISFDADIGGTGDDPSNITVPSISPSQSGELLYSGCSPYNFISAPDAGNTLGQWTGTAGGIIEGLVAEYDLSGMAGSQPVDYTYSGAGGGPWSAMIMAFTLKDPISIIPPMIISTQLGTAQIGAAWLGNPYVDFGTFLPVTLAISQLPVVALPIRYGELPSKGRIPGL